MLVSQPRKLKFNFFFFVVCVLFRKRNTEFSHKLCAPKREYADIANRGMSVFYDDCKV